MSKKVQILGTYSLPATGIPNEAAEEGFSKTLSLRNSMLNFLSKIDQQPVTHLLIERTPNISLGVTYSRIGRPHTHTQRDITLEAESGLVNYANEPANSPNILDEQISFEQEKLYEGIRQVSRNTTIIVKEIDGSGKNLLENILTEGGQQNIVLANPGTIYNNRNNLLSDPRITMGREVLMFGRGEGMELQIRSLDAQHRVVFEDHMRESGLKPKMYIRWKNDQKIFRKI